MPRAVATFYGAAKALVVDGGAEWEVLDDCRRF
jgi:hypothetical protein